MSRFRNLVQPFAAAAVLFAAMDASSLTLGRLEGSAVIGRPLDVSVVVQPGPGGDAAVACLDATVAYGDARQSPGSISLGVDPRPDQSLLVNVYVHASVSEPVVTVELHAGCGTKVSRQYTLFADPAGSERAVTAAPTSAMGRGASSEPEKMASATAPVARAPESERKRAPSSDNVPPSASPTKDARLAAKAPVLAADPSSAPALSKAPASSPSFKSQDQQQRAESLQEPKPAPASTPEPSAQPLQALEADLKALQAATAKNQQNVERLTGSVDTPEPPDYSSLLMVLAAGMLAIAALLAFWRSRLRAKSAPWWEPAQDAPHANLHAQGGALADAASVGESAPATPAPSGPQHDDSAGVEVDIVLGDSDFQGLAAMDSQANDRSTAAARPAINPLGYAQATPTDTLSSQIRDMPDVRQQAEFFVALGQHEEATKVLEASIDASAESIPSVYLDLLALLHTLSRREEFEHYRGLFQQQFTGLLPSYSSFLEEGNGLETYSEICNQIGDLWPSGDALAYIEACLIRQPEDHQEQGFDLLAFRDLLMLHGMLRHLGSAPDSQPATFTTSDRQGLVAQSAQQEREWERDSQLNLTEPFPPLPQAQERGDGGSDFDLTAPPNNLIEFDIGDLGQAKKRSDPPG
jgi:hypothetical protein